MAQEWWRRKKGRGGKVAADYKAKTKSNEGRRWSGSCRRYIQCFAILTSSIVHGESGRLGEANQAEKGNRLACGKPGPHGVDHTLVPPYFLAFQFTSPARVPHALFHPENLKHYGSNSMAAHQPDDTRTTRKVQTFHRTIVFHFTEANHMPAALPPAPSFQCTPTRELSETVVALRCPDEYR
jgi:hypothetical protein